MWDSQAIKTHTMEAMDKVYIMDTRTVDMDRVDMVTTIRIQFTPTVSTRDHSALVREDTLSTGTWAG